MFNVISILMLSLFLISGAQDDSKLIKNIFHEALNDSTSWNNLETLCKKHKGRITGSEQAAKAVDFTYDVMNKMNLDMVWKQPVMVPKWVRGNEAKAYFITTSGVRKSLNVTSLGMSVSTGDEGISAEIIEIVNFNELAEIGKQNIKGKIVFYNPVMDSKNENTFGAYGAVAGFRTEGASKAATYGASGVIIRSLTSSTDDFPHTGVMRYDEKAAKIPAIAISTNDAEKLSTTLKNDKNLKLYFWTNCRQFPDVESFNVIGEIKGSEFPDEIITIGGHLDAWDIGEGAHDDGAGCMQSIEVLRLFKKMGIKPKRTIRAVMFMDEEVAQRGGKEYARIAKIKGEKHYFALEADRGAFMPLGFGVSTTEEKLLRIKSYAKLLEPYGIKEITSGGGGADIGPLREFGTPLSSFIPEMKTYFNYHHSANDVFENVNFREFQMGSASIASFIYLIDKYNL